MANGPQAIQQKRVENSRSRKCPLGGGGGRLLFRQERLQKSEVDRANALCEYGQSGLNAKATIPGDVHAVTCLQEFTAYGTEDPPARPSERPTGVRLKLREARVGPMILRISLHSGPYSVLSSAGGQVCSQAVLRDCARPFEEVRGLLGGSKGYQTLQAILVVRNAQRGIAVGRGRGG